MLKYIVALILVWSGFSASGQKQQSAVRTMLHQAVDLYDRQSYSHALKLFQRIVDEKKLTDSAAYYRALSFIPRIYMQTGKRPEAIKGFKTLILSGASDTDTTGVDALNAYTNYKHDAALFLAQISFNDSDFTDALRWLSLADTTYPYYTSAQNATAAVKGAAGILGWQQQLLIKLDRKEDFIQRSVYELIAAQQYSGYFSAQQVALSNLIAPEKDAFLSDFNTALNNLELKEQDSVNQYIIMTFRGRRYFFKITTQADHTPYIVYRRVFVLAPGRKMTTAGFAEMVRNSLFYKRLIHS